MDGFAAAPTGGDASTGGGSGNGGNKGRGNRGSRAGSSGSSSGGERHHKSLPTPSAGAAAGSDQRPGNRGRRPPPARRPPRPRPASRAAPPAVAPAARGPAPPIALAPARAPARPARRASAPPSVHRQPRSPRRFTAGDPGSRRRPRPPRIERTADESDKRAKPPTDSPVVVRTFRRIVEVVPGFIKAVIAALAVALLIASAAWFLLARNARFLRRQREKLVGEIGVLQGALLPNVPPELSRLEASVAYRPAEGLAAGGDFYDAFPLERGHVGIVVGDVAGPRQGRADAHRAAALHDARLPRGRASSRAPRSRSRAACSTAASTRSPPSSWPSTTPSRHVLRYATAGHPPPVFLGEADHVPVTRSSSPPIGAMLPTGLRQTTVSLPAGSAVCFFTDGLIEARRDGGLIGRLGLVDIIRELGPRAPRGAAARRAWPTRADHVGDDMAACMFRVADGPAADRAPAASRSSS